MNSVASVGLVGSWYLSWATRSLRKVSLSKSFATPAVVAPADPVDPVPAVEPVEAAPVTFMPVMALLLVGRVRGGQTRTSSRPVGTPVAARRPVRGGATVAGARSGAPSRRRRPSSPPAAGRSRPGPPEVEPSGVANGREPGSRASGPAPAGAEGTPTAA